MLRGPLVIVSVLGLLAASVTANALGLTFPPSLLLRADHVIE